MRPEKRNHTLLALFVAGFVSAAIGSDAQAQPNRVFVSARSGSDSNIPCDSITSPCQSFKKAVEKVASGGSVIVLDTGGYGPVTIDKSVTIDSPPGIVAFIHPPTGAAITVAASSSDTVVLRGISLNAGDSYGVNVTSVGALHFEDCTVVGFTFSGLRFATSGQLFAKDSTFSNNGGEGILVDQGGKASIDRCRLEGNGFGRTTGALVAATGAIVTARDSIAAGNFRGFQAGTAAGQTVQLNVENCLSTTNAVGLLATDGAGTIMRVSDTVVTNNTLHGIEIQGSGSILTRSNNTVEGNAPSQAFSGTYGAR